MDGTFHFFEKREEGSILSSAPEFRFYVKNIEPSPCWRRMRVKNNNDELKEEPIPRLAYVRVRTKRRQETSVVDDGSESACVKVILCA